MKKKSDSPLSDIYIGQVTQQWAAAHHLKSFYLPEVASTSTWAKSEALSEDLSGQPFSLYLTDSQTAGRGRSKVEAASQQSSTTTWSQGRAGGSLLCTWSFECEHFPRPTCTALIGLALWKALSSTWSFLPFSLKAPNDIYLGADKLAGLLVETISQGTKTRLLVGLGLNVLDHPFNVKGSTSLVENLSLKKIPLLGEDWSAFLDRLFLELTEVVQKSSEEISTTDEKNILWALNLHPTIKDPFVQFTIEGHLLTENKKTISWMEL